MRRSAAVALAGLVALGVPACGSDKGSASADPAALEGSTWVLDVASTGSLASDVPSDARIDIRFERGDAGGKSACNTYSGSYDAADDGSMSFGAMASTQMACAEPLRAVEAGYLSALGKVTTYEVSSSGLSLTGDGVELRYSKEAPVEALPLEGTAWTADALNNGTGGISTILAGTEVTLTLADGAASGTDGCNTLSGPYELDGDSLSFGALATTRMACADDVMAQATAVLNALDAVATWSIEGDRLTLVDGEGTTQLAYTGVAA